MQGELVSGYPSASLAFFQASLETLLCRVVGFCLLAGRHPLEALAVSSAQLLRHSCFLGCSPLAGCTAFGLFPFYFKPGCQSELLAHPEATMRFVFVLSTNFF